MEISVYNNTYDNIGAIERFLELYYSSKMHYLASDLLLKGLSPNQISDAIIRAMKIGASSGIEIQQHFKPIFSQRNNEVVRDCKLSQLGYALVLMNADAEHTLVGQWQVRVLQNYLE